jgi:hypothetical protein
VLLTYRRMPLPACYEGACDERASSSLSPWQRAGGEGLGSPVHPSEALTLALAQREGPPLMRRPSADAVAGNGGPLNCAPSADAVAGNGGPLSWAPSADAVAGGGDRNTWPSRAPVSALGHNRAVRTIGSRRRDTAAAWSCQNQAGYLLPTRHLAISLVAGLWQINCSHP